uniref:phosphoserine transaminase n=1 Tax=Riptortus pedestris TaxID=329032 RepID=R4WHU5_RIPPE|nr:phosphoserine aminotransferase [Riptortus pedestris]
MSVINFGAGPAKLPREVMLKVKDELLDFDGQGISIMEMSHRCPEYDRFNNKIEQLVREQLSVPDNYKIFFLQGGGTALFAAVAMNLMGRTGTADYFVTGSWSAKAAKEAAKYGKVNLVLPKTDQYIGVPDKSTWNLSPNASYVYYCDNETIHGVEFPFIPEVGDVPLVADMSSNILTRRFDVSKFGVIFAAAQKNIGPPGVVLVIAREDLLGNPLPITPLVMDFTVNAKDKSVHNTPPTFSFYVLGLVFEWCKAFGGLDEMEKKAKWKSEAVYDVINRSNGFYSCLVKPEYRSKMNATFKIRVPELEAQFLSEAKKLGMIQLKGHRSVGGIRVSLYNAITLDEVKVLVKFMEEFYNKNKI